jgi:hypothetical protein
MQFKSFEKKSCIDDWVQKNIEHQKFTQLPHQISNGPPFTTYCTFCTFLCYLHLQKLLLLSYFSTHFPTLFLLFLKF